MTANPCSQHDDYQCFRCGRYLYQRADAQRADEVEALQAEVERLSGARFPDSRNVAVVLLSNGEPWACAPAVRDEILRLREAYANLSEITEGLRMRSERYGYAHE